MAGDTTDGSAPLLRVCGALRRNGATSGLLTTSAAAPVHGTASSCAACKRERHTDKKATSLKAMTTGTYTDRQKDRQRPNSSEHYGGRVRAGAARCKQDKRKRRVRHAVHNERRNALQAAHPPLHVELLQ